jgi:protein O-GlcNAc transferase
MPKLNPRQAQLLQDLYAQGRSLLQSGDAEAAIFSYEAALEIAPREFDIIHMLGIAYSGAQKHDKAERMFKRALGINPGSAPAHLNYGISLKHVGRLDEALEHQRRAAALQPGDANVHYNLANTLRDVGRITDAIAHYEQTLAQKPNHQEALNNLCNVLESTGKYTQAADYCQRLIELGSPLANLHGRLMLMRARSCDWQNYQENCAALLRRVDQGEQAATPFTLLPLPSDAAQQKHCAAIYTQANHPIVQPLIWKGERYTHPRIRIAYFSSDFFSHAVAHLLVEVLEKHDRDRFEVFAFAFGATPMDAMRLRLENAVEHFIEVSNLTDLEIAQLARKHEIDIAIDLNGYSDHTRTDIFAARCAPIQVNYLGYPGTMGADFIDYIVADHTLIPVGHEDAYTEKVLRLPDCYQPNDRQRAISASTPSRQEVGLPEDSFVFCCFNNNFKITPDLFDIWMRLLKKVAGSVLWLFEDSPAFVSNLQKEAASRGIPPQRLVFAPRMEHAQHLARQRNADLFLDTFHYNAHTTTSDALWAGLPVLTCLGQTFASRVAASLLMAVGLPELITVTAEEYEARALQLASRPEEIRALRQHLLSNQASLPLFDSTRYTRHLEQLFAAIHDRQQQGLAPDHINAIRM